MVFVYSLTLERIYAKISIFVRTTSTHRWQSIHRPHIDDKAAIANDTRNNNVVKKRNDR